MGKEVEGERRRRVVVERSEVGERKLEKEGKEKEKGGEEERERGSAGVMVIEVAHRTTTVDGDARSRR